MSLLDELLLRVADAELRESLTSEFKVIQDRKRFGLVFERHSPESVETPGVRPRRGNRAVRKTGSRDAHLRVIATKGTDATVVELGLAGDPSEPFVMSLDDLTVVKQFGEPIFAGMKSLGRIDRGGDKPVHTVIRGENFHVLEALLFTHEEKVDVIYIDPPYNTGNKSWTYNDAYVDENDGYKHSKWLAFMERRLQIAKRLLRDTGVIILAIDDNEQARLKLLADDVFGDKNFISNVVWNGGRKNDSRYVSNGQDYMLVYAKSVDALRDADVLWREPRLGLDAIREAGVRVWDESGHDPAEATTLMKAWIASLPPGHPAKENNRFYEFDEGTGRLFRKKDVSWPGGGGPTYDVLHPVTALPVKVPSRGWIFAQPSRMQQEVDAGRIIWGDTHDDFINRKTYLDEGENIVPTSVFERKRTSAMKYLESVLGSKDFPFPKDVDVIARWVNLASGTNPNAVVLDFFAGTGTTAEAVMRLNAQDGGHRQSIVVTNNELPAKTSAILAKAGARPGDVKWEAEGVFEKVTRPRIETVVTGIRRDKSIFSDGLAENVEFLELTYEDENLVALGRRFDAIAPLLWMKAGSHGTVIEHIDPTGYAAPATATYAILFDTDAAVKLAEALIGRDEITSVFIVSDSDAAFQSAARALPATGAENHRLYATYLRSFEINTVQGA